MTRRSNCCCCFSCFSRRNSPPPSAPANASSADVDTTAASPTVATRPDPQIPSSTSTSTDARGKTIPTVATRPDTQIPPSTSTSTDARGKTIEPSLSSPSADQDASSSAVVMVVPPPSFEASSSSTVPETATSSSTHATQPGEGHFSVLQGTTSSSSITNIDKDSAAPQGDTEEVDLDGLIYNISQQLQLIQERKGKKPPQTKGVQQYWPTSSKTFFKLKDFLSEGINIIKDVIPGDAVKTAVNGVLQGMGAAQLVGAGLFVVGNIVERFEEVDANKGECLRLLKEMLFLAKVVKHFIESPRGMYDVIKEATELILEGCTMCGSQIGSSKFSKFFKAPVNKEDLDNFRQEIDRMYRQINTQMGICILDATAREKAPISRRYPDHAVGIEESVKEITDLLEWTSDKNAIAIMLHGFGGIGKTTLADAVFSLVDIQGCKYSAVRLFQNVDSTPNIIELQRSILQDLMAPGEAVPDIRKHEDGQRELALILQKVTAFIYIDNVLRQDELGQLLPKNMNKAKKVRLLLTARDIDVRTAVKVKTYVYPMKGLPHTEAMKLLGRDINAETDHKENQLNSTQLNKIVQSYGGIPKLLELVGGFIREEDDKQKAYRILMEEKEKWDSEVGKIESYLLAYNHLPERSKDPFLDICSFFKGWDWDTVEHIVGQIELKMLESRALVTRGTDGVVAVHDVILSIGLRKTEGVRFTFTSGNQLKELLNEKKIPEIKGIWLSENNKDLLDIPASKLDSMCSSLRVLALGNLIKVQGTCNETFKELVFLQAAVTHLPFDVSQSKGLKYLKYEPRDLNFHEIPSSVTCMEFDGSSHSHAFKISSGELKKLQILRLTHFVALKKLPEELGDQLNGLRELTLSYCSSVEELPGSMSRLQYLRVIRMEYCSSLRQLPEDFGSLISLQKLNLQGCENLKVLRVILRNSQH